MVKNGKTFTIFGDSIICGINQNEMNKHSKGNIHLKSFRGATCKDRLSYVQQTLEENLMELLFMWELMMCQ